MRNSAFKAFVKKESLLLSHLITFYFIAGMLSITPNLVAKEAVYFISSIITITLFVAFYCHLAVAVTVFEIREKNNLFLMTLPWSARFLYLAKFAFNWLVFAVMWLAFIAAIASALLFSSGIPSMLFSLYVIIFSLFPAAFSVVLTVGLIARSEGITILTFVLCNVVTTIVSGLLSNHPEVVEGFPLGTFSEIGWIWPSWTGKVVMASLLVTAAAFITGIGFGLGKIRHI